jgi:hypothetical protein
MPLLPDPYPQLLTDEELRSVAWITINWAYADAFVSLILEHLYNIAGDTAKELIHSLEMPRKIDRLMNLNARGKIPKGADFFLRELKYAHDNFKRIRNVFSHGMILADEHGNWSALSPKGPKADPKELALALEQSKYTGLVANRLVAAVFGQSLPPLPERPLAQLSP